MLNNESKTVFKKIYAIILETVFQKMPGSVHLSIQSAYSLEEAFALAKIEFFKLFPVNEKMPDELIPSFRISLFTTKTFREINNSKDLKTQFLNSSMIDTKDNTKEEKEMIEDMLNSFNEDEPKMDKKRVVPKKPEGKNDLIKEIIKNNDKDKFEKNKTKFSESERKYIKALLK